jgi:hypothetical protein
MNRLLRVTRLSLIIGLGALPLLSVPASGLELGGHDRDGVTVGLQLGAGWNKMDYSVRDGEGQLIRQETGTSADFSGGISVGWARSDALMASLGIYGWKEGGWIVGNPLTASTMHFLAELHWFPGGQGFWIKAGAGAGTLDFSLVTPLQRVTFQKGGWNFSGGAGYELRVTDTAAFGIAYDLRYLTVGAFEGLEDTSTLSHNLSASLRYYMD